VAVQRRLAAQAWSIGAALGGDPEDAGLDSASLHSEEESTIVDARGIVPDIIELNEACDAALELPWLRVTPEATSERHVILGVKVALANFAPALLFVASTPHNEIPLEIKPKGVNSDKIRGWTVDLACYRAANGNAQFAALLMKDLKRDFRTFKSNKKPDPLLLEAHAMQEEATKLLLANRLTPLNEEEQLAVLAIPSAAYDELIAELIAEAHDATSRHPA